MDLLQDLTSIEPAIVLNAAFCERLLKKCGPSLELQQECAKVPCEAFCPRFVLKVPGKRYDVPRGLFNNARCSYRMLFHSTLRRLHASHLSFLNLHYSAQEQS